MSQQNPFYRGLILKLYRSSTEAESVKNYKIRIFRSDFMHIHEYLCEVSFLTTLDIYKDYFKAVTCDAKGCKGCCISCYMHCVTGDRNCPSSSYSLKLLHLYAKGFITKELPDLHCWINWRTLQPTSSLSWCVSHILGSVHH